jgi:hypothetical protein
MNATQPPSFPASDLADKLKTATVQVLFGYRKSPTDWDFARVPLYTDLQEEFRSRAQTAAEALRDSRTPRAYDPQWDLKQDEYFVVSNSPPVGGNFFGGLTGLATMPLFKERKRIRQPNTWVVLAQLDDNTTAVLGGRLTAKSVLSSTSVVMRIIYRDDGFDSLDDTVISLGRDFDWLAWKDQIAVLNHNEFHAMFRDIPALIAQVDANISTITQQVGIDNLDAFRARIKSFPGMMVKLQAIVDRADMHTKPPDVLRKYGEEYSIHVEWNEDAMVFDDSMANQWNILRLLDEARTLGPVTGKKWDTSSKVEV